MFTHLKLCLATAIHNFKWVNIKTYILATWLIEMVTSINQIGPILLPDLG